MNQVRIFVGTVTSVDLEHGTYTIDTEDGNAGGSISLLASVPSVGDTLLFTVQRSPKTAPSLTAKTITPHAATAKGAPRKPGPFKEAL